MKNTKKRMMISATLIKLKRLGLASNSLGVFDAAKRIRGCCLDLDSANSLFAVWLMYRFMLDRDGGDLFKAFGFVYRRGAVCSSGDVSARIVRYSLLSHRDVRSVYRQLSLVENTYDKILASVQRSADNIT